MRTALNEDDVEDAYFTSCKVESGTKRKIEEGMGMGKNPSRAFQFALHHHWEKVESRFNGSMVTF